MLLDSDRKGSGTSLKGYEKEEELEFLENFKKGTKAKVESARNRARTAYYQQKNRANEKQGKPKEYHQAIMKVTGYGSTSKRVLDHLSYISRNGEVEVEDSDGFKTKDKEELADVIDEWSVDFSRKEVAETPSKYVVTFKANNQDEQEKVLALVKSFGERELSEFTYRVDKSRSKNDPHSVILRCTDQQNGASFSDIMNEAKMDLFSDHKIDVKEKSAPKARDVIKIMLSTPPGTDPESTQTAARNFASGMFGSKEHRYLMALHQDTDHPHVHLVVKMTSEDGNRLKTNGIDLHEWRQEWAVSCREQGIKVEASYRSERGKGIKAEKSQVHMMRKHRGQEPEVYKDDTELQKKIEAALKGEETEDPWKEKMVDRNKLERESFLNAAKLLKDHAELNKEGPNYKMDLALSSVLEQESKELPEPETRMEKSVKDHLPAHERSLDAGDDSKESEELDIDL